MFRSPVDGAVSLSLIALICWALFPALQWAALHGVWNAATFDECRETVQRLHGDGATGACWAALRGRSEALLFGFYPAEFQWRPTLVYASAPLALAPLVLDARPGRAAPYLGVWSIIALTLIFGGAGLEPVESFRLDGLLLTLTIGIISFWVAFILGVLLALGRRYAILPLRALCAVAIHVFRGVPLIVLIFAFFFLRAYATPPGMLADHLIATASVIALPTAALIAIALCARLAASPPARRDAARALGLSEDAAFRAVLLPNAFAEAAPAIAFAFAGLFRNTSLVFVASFMDPIAMLQMVRAEAEWNGVVWELAVAGVVPFLLIGLALSAYARRLERRLVERGAVGATLHIEE